MNAERESEWFEDHVDDIMCIFQETFSQFADQGLWMRLRRDVRAWLAADAERAALAERLAQAEALLDRLDTVTLHLEFGGHDKRCQAWTQRGPTGQFFTCTCGRDATLDDLRAFLACPPAPDGEGAR